VGLVAGLKAVMPIRLRERSAVDLVVVVLAMLVTVALLCVACSLHCGVSMFAPVIGVDCLIGSESGANGQGAACQDPDPIAWPVPTSRALRRFRASNKRATSEAFNTSPSCPAQHFSP
jgi:hypothetical protein